MPIFALLSLFAAFAFIFLGNFVYHKDSDNKINQIYLIYCILAAYIAFMSFGLKQSESYEKAYFWLKFSSLWSFLPATLLLFILTFTEKNKFLSRKWSYILIFLPPTIISVLDFFTNILKQEIVRKPWGWSYITGENPIAYGVVVYLSFLSLLIVGFSFRYYRNTSECIKKKQAKYVFIGVTGSTLIAFFAQGLFPLFLPRVIDFIIVASLFEITFIGYAIWKYNLFDITPEKAAQKTYDIMPDAVFLVSVDGVVKSANKEALNSLGFTSEELIGKSITEIIPESNDSDEIITKLNQERLIKYMETQLERREQPPLCVSISASAIKDNHKRILGYIYIARDISQRKQIQEKLEYSEKELNKYTQKLEMLVKERTEALSKTNRRLKKEILEREKTEEKLRESEKKFRILFNSIGDAIFISDIEGKFLEVNQETCDKLGYAHDELVGMHISQLVTSEYQHLIPRRAERVKQEGEVIFETAHRKKDGGIIPFEMNLKRIQYNGRQRVVAVARDITKRKKLEENLLRRNLVYENMGEAVMVSDLDGITIDVNPAFEKLYGWKKEEVIGKTAEILNPPEKSPKIFTMIMESLEEKEIWRGELEVVTKTGRHRIFYTTVSCLRDKNGNRIGSIGINRDVTERIQMREKLLKSEERFQRLLNSLTDAVWAATPNFSKMLYINPAAKSISGKTIQDLLENPDLWKEVIHPKDVEAAQKSIEQALNVGQAEVEYRIITEDGKVRWIHDRKSVVYDNDGTPIQIGGIATDITDRKKLQRKLIQLMRAVETLEIGVTISDINEKIIYTNPAEAEMHGYDNPEELIGKNVGVFAPAKFRKPKTVEQMMQMKHLTRESVNIRKDGTIFPVRLMSNVVKDPSGVPFAFITACENITEQKLAEEKLKRYQEKLHNLSIHLQNVREDERKAIAREIHDELGQGLSVIKINLYWIKNRLTDDQSQLTEKVELLSDLTTSLIKKVKGIITDLRPNILDDLGIAAAIEWHLESLSRSTGIKTELSITPETLTLDRERSVTIYRIVQEALTNVIRHSEATKVMVTLEKNDEIKLTIEDNGKGIHEDNLTSLNSFGITGMQERINYWNGDFHIRGVPDEGTTISVRIPTAIGGREIK